MNDVDRLQAENEELRQQIDSHRQREVAELRQQLAEARAEVVHYRSEAFRNVEVGRQLHAEAQGEITRLKNRVQVLEGMSNARPAKSR